MRNIRNVQIDEMFVHILDNRKTDHVGNRTPELIFSDFPIQLEGNQELLEYFAGHISVSLADPAAKGAKFRNINPDQASGICAAILTEQTSLAEGSRSLARLLFNIIKDDMRISSADVAVCLFRDAAEPAERYLGILKIDPSRIFQHVILRVDNKIRITYRVNKEALTKEKLQKCAFIQALAPRRDYDMLLLDRQTGIVREGIIAQFFAERFLDAVDAMDATQRTQAFYKTAMNVFNSSRTDLPPELCQELDQRLTTALGGDSINVNAWVDELPLKNNEALREKFRQAIRENIVDNEFSTDPQVGGRLTRRINYVGDHGLRLSVPEEFFNELVLPVTKKRTPEGEVYEIIIHAKTWLRA